jgi:hypothetical protein
VVFDTRMLPEFCGTCREDEQGILVYEERMKKSME